MCITPGDEKRLQLLNAAQPDQPWKSCAEKRHCIVCERTFRGNAVGIRKTREGGTRLECPTCRATPELWVRQGNPLLSANAWTDWEKAMNSLRATEELACA